MNDEDKKQYIKDFNKADGPEKLDMWDYALEQQVLWEKTIVDMQKIAQDQGVDKKLEKMMEEDIKNL